MYPEFVYLILLVLFMVQVRFWFKFAKVQNLISNDSGTKQETIQGTALEPRANQPANTGTYKLDKGQRAMK
jgi:anionic cell wall polymer biosynthesis LytR-Cps2A-Psr (LCP) family protein